LVPGLFLFDLIVPDLFAQQLPRAYSKISSQINEVKAIGDYAYCATDSGLLILNAQDPTSPILVGRLYSQAKLKAIDASGDYAYLAADDFGLKIIDISNPDSPRLIGTYDTPGRAYDVCIDGYFAYVADEWEGLQIINVSEPSAPKLIENYDTLNCDFTGVYVANNYAYIADTKSGLHIIDVTNPANPTFVGACPVE
jgi:hypothetical protein